MNRIATCERKTKETKISITLNLDGTGKTNIHTGIGFFDHMLDGMARHGLFDLSVSVAGDLDVDCHHTCLLYTSPSPRDQRGSRMPSSA